MTRPLCNNPEAFGRAGIYLTQSQIDQLRAAYFAVGDASTQATFMVDRSGLVGCTVGAVVGKARPGQPSGGWSSSTLLMSAIRKVVRPVWVETV